MELAVNRVNQTVSLSRAPKRSKLTKSYVDQAEYEGVLPKGKDIRWDIEQRGLGLRIYPSGEKVFVISYRINGRKRLMKIGKYGVKTLDEARKDARKKLVAIEAQSDPLAERQDAAQSATVAILCADYMERYAKPFKKSWKEDQRLIDRYLTPNWKAIKVAQIKRADVAALHHKVGKTSYYEANRVKALVSKMWECAREWGITDDELMNPARGIEKFPEKKRNRYVREDEMPKLADSIDQEPNIYIRSAFWLYLLTGLRRSELLKAQWTQLSERQGNQWSLQLSDTKSGAPLELPLSPEAVAIFQRIPRLENNPYVFVGHLKGRPLSSVQKNWVKVRERVDLEDVRINDLRHTVASWLAQSGSNLYLVGKVLNHADQSTTQRYAHLEQKQTRDALGTHGTKLMGIARREGTNVADAVETKSQ